MGCHNHRLQTVFDIELKWERNEHFEDEVTRNERMLFLRAKDDLNIHVSHNLRGTEPITIGHDKLLLISYMFCKRFMFFVLKLNGIFRCIHIYTCKCTSLHINIALFSRIPLCSLLVSCLVKKCTCSMSESMFNTFYTIV